MLALFKLLSLFPLWMLHALGWALGWVVFAVSPTYRRRLKQNANQAGYGADLIRSSVGQIGRMVAELPKLWLGVPPPHHWDNTASADAAYAAGKGVVFLTPHLGCFEVTAQALAKRYSQQYGPITVMFRPARKAFLNPVLLAARQQPGMQTTPTTYTGVRHMIKALRRGQAVGLLPDQVPPEGMGLWVPFFGKTAYTTTLAARLALQTGASIRMIWGERLPWSKGYVLHCRELSTPLAESLETAVTQLNAEIEALIRQCPEQYLWGYGRYKQPRQDASADKDTP